MNNRLITVLAGKEVVVGMADKKVFTTEEIRTWTDADLKTMRDRLDREAQERHERTREEDRKQKG